MRPLGAGFRAFASAAGWVFLVGCTSSSEAPTSSNPGGAGAGGTGGSAAGGTAGGMTEATSDPLFTDPSIPHCDGTGVDNYYLQGTVDGQSVQFSTYQSASINGTTLAAGEDVNGTIRADAALTFTPPLIENKASPLVGTSLLIPDGQPAPAQTLCITDGQLGTPTLSSGATNRPFFFHVTGAKSGDCNGAAVTVDLGGCLVRFGTAFPNLEAPDGGIAN
ncbi:MAG TPA: hypothetical protein VMI54_01140 [Polyangiaceae bacterium]|nr:hypothetical protein [Polyangiaceae bacterium]